jgi:hypothetical protein
MTNSQPTTDTSKSRSTQRVSEWHEEVKTFFAQDWSRLRDLIMQLEEESWCARPAGNPTVESTETPAETEDASSMPADNVIAESDAGERPRSTDRLTEIAWQIERRLCTTRPGRK